MRINGVPCYNPLCANALLSGELRDGTWVNLYEIMLPDIADASTGVSTVQYYVNLLHDNGLDVAGFHFHWTGAPGHLAIHHQKLNMDPEEFTQRTLAALLPALSNLERVQQNNEGHVM